MGKRLIRIFGNAIPEKNKELTGQTSDIILDSKSTFHGIITEVNASHLTLMDERGKKHSFLLNMIAEVIYDRVSNF